LAALTALVTVGVALLLVPAYQVWRRAVAAVDDHSAEDSLLDLSRRDFFAPIHRMWILMGVRLLVDVAGAVVVTPVVLWLAVALCRLVGLSVTLPAGATGLGAVVVAGVVTDAVRAAVQRVTRWLTGPRRLRPAMRDLTELGLVLIGLWLAVRLLDGVDMAPAAAGSGPLVLVTLAAVYTRVNLWISVPGLFVLLLVVIAALKLWLVSWLSSWCAGTLQIDDVGALLVAASFLAVLTLPSRLAEARPRSGVTVGLGA
jgi:hypothetical protein